MKANFGIVILMVAGLLTACNSRKVYDQYDHTPISGWEKNDTLTFDIGKQADSGRYDMNLGLRINNTYPFIGLTLIVEQTVFPGKATHSDTLNCKLTDRYGRFMGHGVSYYQYHFKVNELSLQQGDSLHITVRHDMKREILPGISDIGISLKKQAHRANCRLF